MTAVAIRHRTAARLRQVANQQSAAARRRLPTLLLNARGNEEVVVRAFRAIDQGAWELRARLLPTLAGIASDRRGQEDVQAMCIEPVREVLFDRSAAPQLRVLALNLLTRSWLSVDDVLRLKNGLREESKGMRLLLTDYLRCYW